MGCVAGKPDEYDRTNERISGLLKQDRKKQSREIKLLLLGTGESGKSTIAKQLRILHGNGFTPSEMAAFKPVVTNNVLSAYKNIIIATENFGQLPALLANASDDMKEAIIFFETVEPLKDEVNSTVAKYIKLLWASPIIQETLTKYSQFQLPECTFYFTERIDDISQSDYVPNREDALRCRARSTGIMELEFVLEDYTFRIVDVGGQRSERKKWIHVFEGVNTIIFCVALSEYDQKLYEDEKVNRMHEAIQLFEEICNSEYFVKSDIMLFFNKEDLFRDKIARVDLSTCFPDYTGGKDFDKACTFIRDKFFALNKNPKKQIFSKVTCATDTKNIELVFAATKNMILQRQLTESGF